MTQLSWLDLILALVLGLLVIKGWLNGFIKAMAQYIALVVAVIISLRYMDLLAHFFQTIIPNLPLFLYPLFTITLLVIFCLLFFWLISLALSHWVNSTPLGNLDKIGGALFGAAKFYLLIVVLAFLVGFLPSRPKWVSPIKNAVFIQLGEIGLPYLSQIAPRSWQKALAHP